MSVLEHYPKQECAVLLAALFGMFERASIRAVQQLGSLNGVLTWASSGQTNTESLIVPATCNRRRSDQAGCVTVARRTREDDRKTAVPASRAALGVRRFSDAMFIDTRRDVQMMSAAIGTRHSGTERYGSNHPPGRIMEIYFNNVQT